MINIFVTARFIGFHQWSEAPEEVKFLRNLHRHEFHVRVEFSVSHSDRDLEFFIMKRKVTDYLEHKNGSDLGGRSCEQLAQEIYNYFKADGYSIVKVEVSEDGENGAILDFRC